VIDASYPPTPCPIRSMPISNTLIPISGINKFRHMAVLFEHLVQPKARYTKEILRTVFVVIKHAR
jgi:hypothetical protein